MALSVQDYRLMVDMRDMIERELSRIATALEKANTTTVEELKLLDESEETTS